MNTASEIRRFHAILAKLGSMSQKPTILSAYGVTSTKRLSLGQLQEINQNLEKQLKENEEKAQKLIKKRRATVLTLATDAGIKEKEGYEKFNRFMLKSSIHHKEFFKYTADELNDLIKQFRQILINNERAAKNKA